MPHRVADDAGQVLQLLASMEELRLSALTTQIDEAGGAFAGRRDDEERRAIISAPCHE